MVALEQCRVCLQSLARGAGGFIFVCVGAALISGCRPPSPPAAQATPSASSSDTKDRDLSSLGGESPQESDPGNDSTSAAEPVVAAEESAARTSSTESTPIESSAEPADTLERNSPPPRERLLFLLADGPLVVDVELTIDGHPYTEALAAIVERALDWCDTDGDGKPTWKEAASSPRFLYGQVGNSPTKDPGAAQKMISMYDLNRNGLVERDELPRFLTRNAGKARPFTWSTSNEYHDTNRARSTARRWLDEDDDGLLSPEEISRAPARLRLRDADGDDLLTAGELRDTLVEEPDRLSNRRQSAAPDSVFLIGPQADWAAIHYAFREVYAGGGDLRTGASSIADQLIAQLDKNSDGHVASSELSSFNSSAADLNLIVRCGKLEGEERVPPLEAQMNSERLTRLHPKNRFSNRFSLEYPTATLEFFVNDQMQQENSKTVAEALIKRFDTNSDGYLVADEFPQQELGMQVPLAAVDENQDEKVYADELAVFLEQRDAATRSQIRGRAADHPDALFTALDTDGDGRLQAREIEQSPERLRQMDQDGDGQVSANEIPASLVVGFVRGNPQQEAALFVAPPPAVLEVDQSLPKWFVSMDANGDGEISRLEFLGTSDLFERLDANQDRFLSPEEAAPKTTDTTGENG